MLEKIRLLQLQCNHLTNPLAVGGDIVLSFWKNGEGLDKFLLGLASSQEKLQNGEYDVFCKEYENVVEVPVSLQAKAGQRVFWHVKTAQFTSETAYFDFAESFTGAKWITTPQTTREICSFTKRFALTDKPVMAKLLVCGLGFFDGEINGEKFDSHYFKPNVTDYKKRTDKNFVEKENYFAVYNTYEVTHLLMLGANELAFQVSGGYYHNADRYDAPDWDYGDCRLKFELICYYPDGQTRIFSDENCAVATTGNYSTLFLGDKIDFRPREIVYGQVKVVEDDICLRASSWKDDTLSKWISPQLSNESETVKIYDFGKNHTGGIACFLRGKKGTKVIVRYAEVQNEDGSLNFLTGSFEEFIDGKNIPQSFAEQQKAKTRIVQENAYILSGNKDEILPLFSWRCYRFVEMRAEEPFTVEGMRSAFIHMDIEKIGDFSCSEWIFNDIYEKYLLTQRNNMHCGLATDCPHREKVAYTGDGHIVAKSVLYNFDAEGFYQKWLKDIASAQSVNGFIPNSAPDMATGGGYYWGFAVMRLPEILYQFTGKKEYLQSVYGNMRRWVEYLNTRHDGDCILLVNDRKWLLSDWLSPEKVQINCRYFSTVCFFASVKILCKVHEILYGEKDEAFETLAERIRRAVNDQFFDEKNMRYCNGVQGESVIALYYGIPDKEYEKPLQEAVRKHYTEKTNGHFDTGIVTTPLLLQYLTENGMKDIAYEIMTKTDYPSYAYMLQGETTLPEHWSKKWIEYSFSDTNDFVVAGGADVSHCHPMYGSVVEWLYEKVAGLDLTGLHENTVRVSPRFIKEIKKAHASVALRKGVVAVEYENENGFLLKVRIPQGLTGKVRIEDLRGRFFVKGKVMKEVYADGVLELELDGGEWKIEKI